ncbi:MAG: hypothetical protein RLZ71_628 [Actinomycetota bacterium]|jgi:predicted amidophosphoribosyltransferase
MTLLDILAPTACIGCHRLGKPLCLACANTVPIAIEALEIGLHGWCATRYNALAANIVNEVKERGRTELASWMAAAFDSLELPEDLTVVAVPSRAESWRKRGFVPAEEFAKRLAARHRLRFKPGALTLTRATRDQADLTRAERLENLTGAMRANSLSGRILIVDDIVTTGSSIREASRALAEAGAEVFGFITFAQTQRENYAPANFRA